MLKTYRWLAVTLFSIGIMTPVSTVAQAQTATLEGEVLRITKKRTGALLSLAGDLEVAAGQRVKLVTENVSRRGMIRKITKNGRAFVRFRKALPASIAKGNTYTFEIIDGAPADPSEPPTTRGPNVLLAKGFKSKAYWDDVSYLATHRRAGLRSDVEISYLSAVGARDQQNGVEEADIEYSVEQQTTAFTGAAGYVGRSGIGGGILLEYKRSNVAVSADVETTSTATTDKVSDKWTETTTDVTPYVAWISRPKTGDLGFGVGVGALIRSTEVVLELEDAEQKAKLEPAKSQLVGPTFEIIVNSNTWASILQISPGITGKEEQSDSESIQRRSSEYGLHAETYGNFVKTRFGLVYLLDEGSNSSVDQQDRGFRFSTRLDFDLRTYHLIPFFDYTQRTRKLDFADGKQSSFQIGSRIAWAGIYAPFISLAVSSESQVQSGDGIPDSDSTVGGFLFSGGLSI